MNRHETIARAKERKRLHRKRVAQLAREIYVAKAVHARDAFDQAEQFYREKERRER